MYHNMLTEKQNEAKHRLELMQGILDAQESEKKIISNTVHDSVGSLFMMMKGNTSQLKSKISDKELRKRVDSINSLIELLDKEIRKSIYSLTPSLLQDYGFKVAIDEYVKLLQNNYAVQVNYSFQGDYIALDERAEVSVYRMIQEMVNNALKYAETNRMSLSIIQSLDKLTIEFDDHGKGFEKNLSTKGLGLKNIESRVLLLSGKYKIDSALGSGTKYWIELPVQINRKDNHEKEN